MRFLQPPEPPKCVDCGAVIEDPLFDHTGRCEQCWTENQTTETNYIQGVNQ